MRLTRTMDRGFSRGRSRTRARIVGATVAWLVVTASPAATVGVYTNQDIRPEELAALPEYCPHTAEWGFRGTSAKTERRIYYESFIGEFNMNGLHHYCWALAGLMRIAGPSKPNQRRYYLEHAIRHIDYVLRNVKPPFILMPEVLTKRAEVMARLGQRGEAVRNYQGAIEAKADYWPAYSGLATLYRAMGDVGKAREVVAAGLDHAPNARMLLGLQKDLGVPAGRAPAAARQPLQSEPETAAIPAQPATTEVPRAEPSATDAKPEADQQPNANPTESAEKPQ